MKSKLTKIISASLVVAMICACSVFVFAEQGSDDKSSDSSKNSSATQELKSKMKDLVNEEDVDKEETVYVVSKADGTPDKIIVSDWVKNKDKEDSLNDKTELENITNVNGDEEYVMNDDNMCVWDAKGKDIYYQGETSKELPVNVSISYKLDGQDISAEDLAGKSGNVTITFNYTNNQKQEATINGKKQDIYVPFVMLSGTILDNSNFENIKVSNGKVINDGDRTVVVGFAMPGMQENLNVSKDELELPDSVEITADVTDFSLDTTMTVATNELFNHLNLDKVDSIDDLTNQLKTLSDSSKQLVDGSSKLYESLTLLLEKSGDLISGVSKLADGSKSAADNSALISGGLSKVKDGTITLDNGLQQLSQMSGTLDAGAKQVFNTLLSTANTQLKAAGVTVPTLTIENYSKVLNGVISSLGGQDVYNMVYNTALKQVTAEVDKNTATITEQVTAAVKQQVLAGVLKTMNMTVEQYQAAVGAGQVTAEVQAKVNGAVEQQMATEQIKQTITKTVSDKKTEIINQQMKSTEIQAKINQGVTDAKNGQSSIKTLLDQLNSYNQFYTGVLQYTGGVDKAASGSSQLKQGIVPLANGSQQLTEGLSTLNGGMQQLKESSTALVDAIGKIQEGSMTLSEGMKKFNDEGISKIVKLADGNLKDIVERVKAIAKVSNDYQSFGGKSDEMTGSVKFIFRTEGIEAKKSDK